MKPLNLSDFFFKAISIPYVRPFPWIMSLSTKSERKKFEDINYDSYQFSENSFDQKLIKNLNIFCLTLYRV